MLSRQHVEAQFHIHSNFIFSPPYFKSNLIFEPFSLVHKIMVLEIVSTVRSLIFFLISVKFLKVRKRKQKKN